MRKKVKVRRMGGSVGTTLPREMADRLKLAPGDTLYAIETENGILLTPFDPDFDEALSEYERGAAKYRNALRELAD